MNLLKYVAIRTLLALPTLLILLVIVFTVMRILPGDPIIALLGDRLTESQIAALRHIWGLDKPIPIQFLDYLRDLVTGNLGISIISQEPVSLLIQQSFPATFELSILAITVGSIGGIGIAILAVQRVEGIVDELVKLFTVWAYSIPVFWLSLLMQIMFAVWVPILPLAGRLDPNIILRRITGLNLLDSILSFNGAAFVNSATHLALPTLALSLWCIPVISRICRSSMISTFGEQYIVTAKAKGLRHSEIMMRYAFRNALLPTVTVIGTTLMDVLGGSVIIETIFSWPGMGRLFYTSALNRDFPVMQGIVVVYVLLVIALSTILDMVYSIVDPRVRLVKA